MSVLKLYGRLVFSGLPSGFDPVILDGCKFQPQKEEALKRWLNAPGRLELVNTVSMDREGVVSITFYDYGLNFDPRHTDFRLARVLAGVTVHKFHSGRLEFHDPNSMFKGFTAFIETPEMTATWHLEHRPRKEDPFPTRRMISIEAHQQPDHPDASSFLERFEAGLRHFLTEGVPPTTMTVTGFAW